MKKSTKKNKKHRSSQKPEIWPTVTKYSHLFEALNANNIIILLLFFIQMVWTFPQPVIRQTSGLDPSWINALYTMVLNKMQFGHDVIFTYGPLGFLSYSMLIDYSLWRIAFLFQVFIHVLLYLSVYVLLRRLGAKWYHYLFMLPILLFANLSIDELLMILISIMLFISLTGDHHDEHNGAEKKNHGDYIWLALSGLLVSVSSLLKFNSLIVSLTLLVIAFIIFIFLKRDYKPGLFLMSCFILSFIILWLATGQNLTNVPGYIQYGIELSRGYTPAMSLEGFFAQSDQFSILIISVFCVFCLLIYSIAERKANILIFIIMNLALLFSSYKHGFVRHDLHVLSFFQMYLLVLGILFVMVSIELKRKTSYLCVFSSAMTFIVLLILISTTNTLAPSTLSDNILTRSDSYTLTGQMLLNQSVFDTIVAAEKETIKNDYSIDNQTLKYIDNSSIDVFPWDISLCWAYSLNWSPRLVIQSYSDYTAALDNGTSQHFINKDPPQLILYSYKSIDGRYPLYDEPATFHAILDHYDYVRSSGEFALLNRSEGPGKYEHSDDLGTIEGKIGQEIKVPKYDGLVFGHIQVKYSTYGKLLDALYKPSDLYVQFKFIDGNLSGVYRIISDIAGNGLLLSDYVGDEKDLIGLFKGNVSNNVEGIRIFSENPEQYESNVEVNLVGYR